jgi:hypothetical protein
MPVLAKSVPTEWQNQISELELGKKQSTRLRIPAFEQAGLAVYLHRAIPFAERAVLQRTPPKFHGCKG